MTTLCYAMNGTADAVGRYIPCNTTAVNNGGHSACCAPGDNCLTNGLCQGQGDAGRKANLFWRNGCTDPTWQDPACARQCVGNGAPDTKAVYYCLSGNDWCCSTGGPDFSPVINTTCCSISSLEFNAASPTVYTQAALNFVSTASGAIASSTGSVSSLASSSTPTHTSGASSASATSSPASSSSSGGGSKTGIYVGVPLGIVLALALAAIAWLVLRKRRNPSQSHELATNYPNHNGPEKRSWFMMQPSELPNNQPAAVELSDGHGYRMPK